jgi:hypothetical protein
MEGFLEATHRKVGQRKRDVMAITQKMIRLGYFLSIILSSSKFNKKKNIWVYAIVAQL